jgi:hypothetical protein
LDVLKRVDSTYTVNTECSFQVRNASGYEVELLLPMSLAGTLPRNETLFPIALLLLGLSLREEKYAAL